MSSSEDGVCMGLSNSSMISPRCLRVIEAMDRSQLERYYGKGVVEKIKNNKADPFGRFLKLALSPALQRIIERPIVSIRDEFGQGSWESEPHSLIELDAQVQRAFETFGRDFPTAVWTCCKRLCFAQVAVIPEMCSTFNAILRIYRRAEVLHDNIARIDELLCTRKRGIGGSNLAYVAPSRAERTEGSSSDRRESMTKLRNFVQMVLPFLRGECISPDGCLPPRTPFCVQAICQVLGIQRNTLYKSANGEQCVVDQAGVRQRKFRRIGSRKGFTPILEMASFQCGCDIPCFTGVPVETLQSLWDGFKVLAGELSPEEKEHRYLLNQLFCPLTNSCVRVCNKSVAELYTISEPLVSSLRAIIQQMCDDPSIERIPVREHGLKRYRAQHHPMNKLSEELVEYVERHLDMILRPDPAASDGINVCRVYSPDINTYEKLRRHIAENIKRDRDEVVVSPSSMQRMVRAYLDTRGCRVSFTQADHNACPVCKSLQYEILQLHYDEKKLRAQLSPLLEIPRPLLECDQKRVDDELGPLLGELSLVKFRSNEAIEGFRNHNARDARIRGFIKKVVDHFKDVENKDRLLYRPSSCVPADFRWCKRTNRALLTHQDAMAKADLPHMVKEASSEITRWRYDITAHVNAINGNCVIFAHEQGAAAKTASEIIEEILLDHLLTCTGENIKMIVSDNASVGKNWTTTVVLPQYIVDQGLADVVLKIYLENNHGKWLADMLFGQFQIRKRNSVILGVDGLLKEFERLNRPSGGRVQGFVINPLASVDFCAVFKSLGYAVKPPKEFGYKNRNIHFSGACTPEAKARMDPVLRNLLGNALPDGAGCVRVCAEPPSDKPLNWRTLEERWIDVPVAAVAVMGNGACSTVMQRENPPLAVPLDKTFSASGPGVVPKRTAEHVGFNGLSFRGKQAFPELKNTASIAVQEAWPCDLLRSGEPGFQSESLKCSPENWIVRKPVCNFGRDGDIKARYPPRNLLNALFCNGPREAGVSFESNDSVYWIPTATYLENPMPLLTKTSAASSMQILARENTDISKCVNTLEALRCVFQEIGDRDFVSDPWLQKPATKPSASAIDRYRQAINIIHARDKIRPAPCLTLLQAFRNDPDVKRHADENLKRDTLYLPMSSEQIVEPLFDQFLRHCQPQYVEYIRRDPEFYVKEVRSFTHRADVQQYIIKTMQEQNERIREARTRYIDDLFEKMKLQPGGIERYRHQVEQDKRRYAAEEKQLKESKLLDFDFIHNLLPLQGPQQRMPSRPLMAESDR